MMKYLHSKYTDYAYNLFLLYSFKKLALKNHPLKHPQNMQIHLEKFHVICEAYEVLSNGKLQIIFQLSNHMDLYSSMENNLRLIWRRRTSHRCQK